MIRKRRRGLVFALLVAAAGGAIRVAAAQETAAEGGVGVFRATVPDTNSPDGPAPEGMVWIPGGEFSMGSDRSAESLCSLPGTTRDAVPIHRVYVSGFWMDRTEVSNEEFARFVRATGYVTVAERKPSREEFPTAPPENRGGVGCFQSADRSGCAGESLSMVGLCEGGELAASARAGQRFEGKGKVSGGAGGL